MIWKDTLLTQPIGLNCASCIAIKFINIIITIIIIIIITFIIINYYCLKNYNKIYENMMIRVKAKRVHGGFYLFHLVKLRFLNLVAFFIIHRQ